MHALFDPRENEIRFPYTTEPARSKPCPSITCIDHNLHPFRFGKST
jgi:hypothetical protein